eukprot:6150947-Amphidinium_carterae.1
MADEVSSARSPIVHHRVNGNVGWIFLSNFFFVFNLLLDHRILIIGTVHEVYATFMNDSISMDLPQQIHPTRPKLTPVVGQRTCMRGESAGLMRSPQ